MGDSALVLLPDLSTAVHRLKMLHRFFVEYGQVMNGAISIVPDNAFCAGNSSLVVSWCVQRMCFGLIDCYMAFGIRHLSVIGGKCVLRWPNL
jgi:hypothetical protein